MSAGVFTGSARRIDTTRENHTRNDASADLSPRNVEAEESLLGAMLLARGAIEDVAPHLTPEMFYRPVHGHMFAAICRLHDEGFDADVVTVAEQLNRAGVLTQCGGSSALISLAAGCPSTTNAAHYALIVRDKWHARRALVALNEASAAIREEQPVGDVLETLIGTAAPITASQSTWLPVDMTADWDEPVTDTLAPPVLGTRVDGVSFISPGATGLLLASPESGKSMAALAWCVDAAHLGRHSIYLDFESRPARVRGRMQQHRRHHPARELWHYIRPEAAMTTSDRWAARRLMDNLSPLLVVIDGYNALLAKHSLDGNKASDIARLAEDVVRPWTGPDTCTVLIDHISKDDARQSRSTTAIGSVAKTGLVDWAMSFHPDDTQRIRRSGTGWSTLSVAKDRDGEIRWRCNDGIFGKFAVRSDNTGTWDHRILMPDGMTGPAAVF